MNQLQTMNELTKLRTILSSFKENLNIAIEVTEVEFETQFERYSKGIGKREFCIEDGAKLQAYKDSLYRLNQIEASTI